MADDDTNLEPNLELPKLFGRKKSGKADTARDQQEAAPAAQTPAPSAERPPGRPTAPVSATPQAQSDAQMPAPTPTPTPAAPVAAARKKRGLPTASLPSIRRRAPRATTRRSSLPTLALPPLTGRVAAALTGAVVGLGLVLATVGVLRGCDAIRGTKSCGGAGGFTLLVVLIVLAIYVGAMLLRAFGLPDPGSTSFLAIGIVVVLSMVVFIDSLLDWWMILLIPTLSAGAYALSHYITTAVVEPATDQHRDRVAD